MISVNTLEISRNYNNKNCHRMTRKINKLVGLLTAENQLLFNNDRTKKC